MEEDCNNDIKHDIKHNAKLKYKPSKMGTIALIIAIISLSIGLIAVLLMALSIIKGFIMLIILILSQVVAGIAFIFVMVDAVKFNKTNQIDERREIIYLIIGMIIGFTWGKIF